MTATNIINRMRQDNQAGIINPMLQVYLISPRLLYAYSIVKGYVFALFVN